MRRMCAWCGKDLNHSSSRVDPANPITHGICDDCAQELWGTSGGVPLTEFLAGLDIPTIVVDGDVRVELANADALDLLGKTHGQVAGKLGGEVLDCVNAELPGGCGKTELCPACTVRNTITDTFLTGHSHRRVPTVLLVRRNHDPEDLSFFLTTEKVGDQVLVQIEAAVEAPVPE